MRLRHWSLLLLLVMPGVSCFFFCMYFAVQDWAELQKAHDRFVQVSGNPNLNVLFVAEAKQNIHRLNLFAEVVWALLRAIIAAIGVHGLCVNHWRPG
jgi:hypothetical protein